MPLSKYDPQFNGKGGAAKAHAAMQKTYGKGKKAEQVFYATKNKRKSQGKGK